MHPDDAARVRQEEQRRSAAVVDVTETIDVGVASLREHRTYLEALGGSMSNPDSFLRDMARATGPSIGVESAVSFELVGL